MFDGRLVALELKTVCIRCGATVLDADDEKTLCQKCVNEALQILTIEDCIDIQARCERAYQGSLQLAKMREAKAAKASAGG